MKIRKSDFAILREHEEQGNAVSMTSIRESKRTKLNDMLGEYFRELFPSYRDTFDEDQSEDVLIGLNEYLASIRHEKYELTFPISIDSEVHLIPITPNLILKVLLVDDYLGSGDYEKYMAIDRFLINEDTKREDVDELAEFMKYYITS
jgi:hypothetical protein